MSTLRTPQHSQTRVASPDGYAYGISAQPNGESIAKCLRSEPLSTAKRRRHHQTATLRTPQRSQTETAPPNGYAQNPSTQPNGDGTTKRRSHPQTTTLRPIQSSPLFPSSPSLFPAPGVAIRRWHHPNGDGTTQTATLRTPQRRQTETASPNGYTQNPSAQPNGDGSTGCLRSEPLSAAKRRRHHQTATLRGQEVMSSRVIRAPLPTASSAAPHL